MNNSLIKLFGFLAIFVASSSAAPNRMSAEKGLFKMQQRQVSLIETENPNMNAMLSNVLTLLKTMENENSNDGIRIHKMSKPGFSPWGKRKRSFV